MQGKKWYRVLMILLLALVGIAAVIAAAALAMWLTGRSSFRGNTNVIDLPSDFLEEINEPADEEPEKQEPAKEDQEIHNEKLEGYTIRRGGKLYRQKENVTTLLFLGVDRTSEYEENETEYRTDAHADVLMLAVMDVDAKRTSFLAISRDTMCEFDTYDSDGNYTGVGYGQIALSFRYGDGKKESCRLTGKACRRS